MVIDPVLSGILGVAVWALTWVIRWTAKQWGEETSKKANLYIVAALSLSFGVAQLLMSKQWQAVSPCILDLSDFVTWLFVCVPAVIAVLAANLTLVFSTSQGFYTLINKMLHPDPAA